jgi:hypothetical protein
MRTPTSLSFVLAWYVAAVILAGSAFGQNAQQPKRAPVVSQSACPESARDVDRIACWVSADPETLPPGVQKPPPALLRGPNGVTIIAPKPPQ